ncbi:hypothetical protein N0V90_012433 [Kalmusia sp. IMI 367209]|nr:hypothetical protein N0V90_012433 [Kalmusia sp. IMI 367209]
MLQELLAIARRIFDRPLGKYRAHIHFDRHACVGRAAECEWDSGWYSADDERTVKDGNATFWVHFEKVSLVERIERAKRELGFGGEEERELDRLVEKGDESAGRGKWWEALGWWRLALKAEGEMMKDGSLAERVPVVGEEDNSSVYSVKRKGLPDFVKDEISKAVGEEMSKHAINGRVKRLRSEIFSSITDEIHDLDAPQKKRRHSREERYLNDPHPSNPTIQIRYPWPVYYPSQIPETPVDPEEVMTIDDYSTTKAFSRSLIVGRALPEICTQPNVRPLVRAELAKCSFKSRTPNNTRIYVYMPARYGRNVERTGTGELQIPFSQVEYLAEFNGVNDQELRTNIKTALMQKNQDRPTEVLSVEDNVEEEQGHPVTLPTPNALEKVETIDTYTGSNYLVWDIIIGRACAHICADPHRRPLARATLTQDGRVCIFIPAKYGNDRLRSQGELAIAIANVEVLAEFAASTDARKRVMIRESLLRKKRENLSNASAGGVGLGDLHGEGKVLDESLNEGE